MFLNVRLCKLADDKNDLCSNCGLWPETRMHFFFSCPKTNEIINLLEKILRKAGFLKNGNTRFPYFIYSNYKINTIENLMLIYSLKFIYKCKFDEIKPNLVFYRANLVRLSSVCAAMKEQKPYLTGIESFRECLIMTDI